MLRDIRGTPLHREIERHFEDMYAPGADRFFAVLDLAPSPGDASVAFSGAVFAAGGGMPGTRIALLDGAGGEPRSFPPGAHHGSQPCWSPDGSQLAFLAQQDGTGGSVVHVASGPALAMVRACPSLEGQIVETLRWSPDGHRLLLQTAGAGADAAGSATVARVGDAPVEATPSWMPSVEEGAAENSWRRCWIWDLRDDSVCRIGQSDLTVWEASWCGPDAIAAIVSDRPHEGGWYSPRLAIADAVAGATLRVVRTGEGQMGSLAGSPDGRHVAFVEGCFGRQMTIGIPTVFDLRLHQDMPLPAPGVEVTALHWRSEGRLFFIGQQSFEIRAGTYDLQRGSCDIEWTSTESSGRRFPNAWPTGRAGFVVATHSARRAPRILAIADDGSETILADFSHAGTDRIVASIEDVQRLAWHGRDGLEIHGLLATPAGARRPLPLAVLIHGGPHSSFRDGWSFENPLATLLLRQGYAVLLPNPRGSSGRSQAFARSVCGDPGGEDMFDILAGIDHVIEIGVADARRLLVAGGSYGGYMTTWLTTQTDRFAAACALSPMTHMRSQYFTAHHPEFLDRLAPDGPYAIGGQFDTRSPIMFADRARTPTIFVAGGLDRTTPPSQATEFHHALQGRNVPSQLVVYPEEGHMVMRYESQIDQGARVVAWFARHLDRLAGHGQENDHG